mgnify:CR=1 FL=1
MDLDEIKFWDLIASVKENQNVVPQNVLKEVRILLEQVKKVATCPIYGHVIDYKKALNDLKNLLKKNQQKLPKSIKEKLEVL